MEDHDLHNLCFGTGKVGRSRVEINDSSIACRINLTYNSVISVFRGAEAMLLLLRKAIILDSLFLFSMWIGTIIKKSNGIEWLASDCQTKRDTRKAIAVANNKIFKEL